MTGAWLVVWDDEACWRVHEATLALLEETGVEAFHATGRETLASAGARVDGTRVRIGTELVTQALADAARRITIEARPGVREPAGRGPRRAAPRSFDVDDDARGALDDALAAGRTGA
jgi:trimethylamine:corrinoid methyltransferase-like protein